MNKLEQAMESFHRDNPQVYELFKQYTGRARRSGRKHFGVGAVWERLRWETQIETVNDEFKLNNNHRAYYARKYMRDFPEAQGFFRTRVVRREDPNDKYIREHGNW